MSSTTASTSTRIQLNFEQALQVHQLRTGILPRLQAWVSMVWLLDWIQLHSWFPFAELVPKSWWHLLSKEYWHKNLSVSAEVVTHCRSDKGCSVITNKFAIRSLTSNNLKYCFHYSRRKQNKSFAKLFKFNSSEIWHEKNVPCFRYLQHIWCYCRLFWDEMTRQTEHLFLAKYSHKLV